jgi:hypothetical protein
MVSKSLGLAQFFVMIYTTECGRDLEFETYKSLDDGLYSADDYAFLCEKVKEYHIITVCFVHKIIQSAFKRIQFAHDSMSYSILRAS